MSRFCPVSRPVPEGNSSVPSRKIGTQKSREIGHSSTMALVKGCEKSLHLECTSLCTFLINPPFFEEGGPSLSSSFLLCVRYFQRRIWATFHSARRRPRTATPRGWPASSFSTAAGRPTSVRAVHSARKFSSPLRSSPPRTDSKSDPSETWPGSGFTTR